MGNVMLYWLIEVDIFYCSQAFMVSSETPPKATCHGFLLSLLFAFIVFPRTIVLRGHVTLKYTLFTVVTVRVLVILDNNYLYNKHIYP